MVRQGLWDSARRETDKMDKTEMVRSDVDKGVTRFRLPFSHIRVWFPSCPFPISVPKPGADVSSCTCAMQTRETVAPKALKLRNHRRPRDRE